MVGCYCVFVWLVVFVCLFVYVFCMFGWLIVSNVFVFLVNFFSCLWLGL